MERCAVCGRPAARDAMVKLTVAGRRGPEAVPWLQTAPPLVVCPVCARTRTFRVAVAPLPAAAPEPAEAGPGVARDGGRDAGMRRDEGMRS